MREERKKEVAESGGRGIVPKVGTARFPSRMALRAGGRAVQLLHGRGAQASRLCMSESEATSSTGLALHRSTRPGRPCPILKQQGRLRRESGTPAASGSSPTPRRARHPYQFISKGAAAPIGHMAPPSFPKNSNFHSRPLSLLRVLRVLGGQSFSTQLSQPNPTQHSL
jgi:hypothetical protein